MGLSNTYKVLINNQNVFAKLESKPLSITITDERDFVSDRAEITINNAQNITVPSKDAEVTIFINDTLMGRYKITSISLSSDNGYTLTIQCSGVDFKNKFKTKKYRKFTKENGNNTLGIILDTIASSNEYKHIISDTLKNEVIDDMIQNDETDLQFLNKLAKKFNASLKVNNNTIMLVERAKHNLPTININRKDITSFSMSADNLYNFQSVLVQYQDIDNGGTKEIIVGSGHPQYKIKTIYKSLEMAQKIAYKKLKELSQRKYEISLIVDGNEYIQAESVFKLSNIHDLIDGSWSVDTATHNLNDNGFVTSVKAVSL
ncbi:phage late control D family protein [Francisella philomiragia]|uniref:phage late control D family protein n=1 Tax=Francisella philomiragia TaxID=28110 RepID=UPI002244420B|nr:hypothetical protein [Francisella philomiragia]